MADSGRVFSLALLICVCTTGCASYIHKTLHYPSYPDADKNSIDILSIDAKQRVVVTTQRDRYRITCAEPSPDALSALSTSTSLGLQFDKKALANVASAISGSAASIGLRTQSIQLLRDGMYRTCEAYAAGAIDAAEYNRQQRRYQNLMLALLSVEQLTGPVVAQQVGLGSGSSSSAVGLDANEAAQELADTEKKLKDAKSDLDAAKKKQSDDQKACADGKSDSCDRADTNKAEVGDKEAAYNTADENLKTAKLRLEAARFAVQATAGGAAVHFGERAQASRLTDASAQYIAEATRTIVSTTLLASFAQEECSRIWGYMDVGRSIPKVENALTDSKVAADVAKDIAPELSGKSGLDLRSTLMQFDLKDADGKTLDNSAKKQIADAIEKIPLSVPRIQALVAEGVSIETINEIFQKQAESCRDTQSTFAKATVLYSPQYLNQPPPLKVFGAESEVTIVDKKQFIIAGGQKPYQVVGSDGGVEAKVDYKASPVTLEISLKQAPATEEKTQFYVFDASENFVAVPLKLAKLAPPSHVNATSPRAGEIEVTYALSPSPGVTGYTAEATSPSKPTLTKEGKATDNTIVLSKCEADMSYTIKVVANINKLSSNEITFQSPVTCKK